MRPYTRYPACNTAGFFFAFYFFREGGPVGHKHNLYANRDWGGGGWVGPEVTSRVRQIVAASLCHIDTTYSGARLCHIDTRVAGRG